MVRKVLAAALVLGAAVIAFAGNKVPRAEPDMPAQLCRSVSPEAAPDYARLLVDGRLRVAALFGEMDDNWWGQDHGMWSYRQFVDGLEAMGLEATKGGPGPWQRFEGALDWGLRIEVDVLGPEALPLEAAGSGVGDALREAVQTHEVVYLNGHSFGGALHELGESSTYGGHGYRMVVLDTCWSTQHYATEALAASSTTTTLALIVNDAESVTGSVYGFLGVLRDLRAGAARLRRGLPAPAWSSILDGMNEQANERARDRLALEATTRFSRPEAYRLAAICGASPDV